MYIPTNNVNNTDKTFINAGYDNDLAFKHGLVETLKCNFTDLMLYFDDLVLPAVNNLVRRPPSSLHINPKQILLNNGINKMHFSSSKDQKKILDNVRVALSCAYVMIYEKRMVEKLGEKDFNLKYDELHDEKSFLQKYSTEKRFCEVFPCQYSSCLSPSDKKDLTYMCSFTKYLRLALELLPGYRNKGLAIQIAGRLEGSKEIYVFGSGQRDTSTRREIIYHIESSTPFPTTTKEGTDNMTNKAVVPRTKKTSTKKVVNNENTQPSQQCVMNKRTRSDSIGSSCCNSDSESITDCSNASKGSKTKTTKKPVLKRQNSLYLDDFDFMACPEPVYDHAPLPVDQDFLALADSVTFNFDDLPDSFFEEVLSHVPDFNSWDMKAM